MYASIAWPLYKLYGHAFDAFKVMVQDPDAVFAKLVEVRPLATVLDVCLTLRSAHAVNLDPVCVMCKVSTNVNKLLLKLCQGTTSVMGLLGQPSDRMQ